MTANGESFYPLYDNGRSLFYEDTEEMVRQAVIDPRQYAAAFGQSGTYWDYVQEIKTERASGRCGGSLRDLINLNLTKDEVSAILKEACFTGYRLDGALAWIMKALELVRE